jgi:hypothetical protein
MHVPDFCDVTSYRSDLAFLPNNMAEEEKLIIKQMLDELCHQIWDIFRLASKFACCLFVGEGEEVAKLLKKCSGKQHPIIRSMSRSFSKSKAKKLGGDPLPGQVKIEEYLKARDMWKVVTWSLNFRFSQT